MRRPLAFRLEVGEALTVNDDFTDHDSDVATLVADRLPLFVGIQEGKGRNYRTELRTRYGVRQSQATAGTAGVAVAWDRLRARALEGHGWDQLTPPGHGLLARGVVWQDLIVRISWTARARVRLGATHRPPPRDNRLWPAFDRALARWVDESPYPVLVMLDANQRGGPRPVLAATGLRWHGVGIDGVLTRLPVAGPAVALPLSESDHHPVTVPIRLR